MAQQIPVALAEILTAGEVDFTLLGEEEWCCGFPLMGAGLRDRIKDTIDHNICHAPLTAGADWVDELGADLDELRDTRLDPDIARLQDRLAEKLCAKVALQHGAKGKGKLVISYNSLDELEGILEHIH